jgi:hypothetical protein
MVEAVKVGGLVLDLQVIRPNPRVEVEGQHLCDLDGSARFRMADAAVGAVDALVAGGRLLEEAALDHDVLKHFASGPALLADCERTGRRPTDEARPRLSALAHACATRERCRLRRLRVIRRGA